MAKIEMLGKIFNRLTVILFLGIKKGHYYWKCKCSCGNTTDVEGYDLRSGHTVSCGCYLNEVRGKSSTTHGLTDTDEYRIWTNIKTRCYNKKRPVYKNYGGRGIKLSKEWHDFSNFLHDMGKRPGKEYSIERINVNKGYCKTNCTWIPLKDQGLNQRRTIRLTYNGITASRNWWADELHWKKHVIINRMRYGWSTEEILTTPLRLYKRHFKKKVLTS